jgi:hypothetical protein
VAVVVSQDGIGPWVSVECEAPGCYAHVTVRPVGSDYSRYEMACEAFDIAEREGWRLEGSTHCPRHRYRRAAPGPRVADGYSWAFTVVEGVNGRPRPS